MAYDANITIKGKDKTLEDGKCEESAFPYWLKRAVWWSQRLGVICLVNFCQEPHTFEVGEDGRSLLITPQIVDPALAAQFEGS